MLSLRGAVRTRRIRSMTLKLVMLGLILLIFGFAGFIWLLPSRQVALDSNADGIVVLTGGTSRINDALDLLASGRGKRLLITGVNAGTTTGDIAIFPDPQKYSLEAGTPESRPNHGALFSTHFRCQNGNAPRLQIFTNANISFARCGAAKSFLTSTCGSRN